jgi:hypothetical protein
MHFRSAIPWIKQKRRKTACISSLPYSKMGMLNSKLGIIERKKGKMMEKIGKKCKELKIELDGKFYSIFNHYLTHIIT